MATLKIGINGFGRIGRMVFRASIHRDDIEVVAINDLLDVEHLAYLLKYDSVHGTVDASVEIANGHLVVNGKTVRITAERDPKNLQWDAVDATVVASTASHCKWSQTVCCTRCVRNYCVRRFSICMVYSHNKHWCIF